MVTGDTRGQIYESELSKVVCASMPWKRGVESASAECGSGPLEAMGQESTIRAIDSDFEVSLETLDSTQLPKNSRMD